MYLTSNLGILFTLTEYFVVKILQNVGCGRTWVPLAQVVQNVCVAYLEMNAKSAKLYFLTQIEAIKQLCLCLKSPSSKILIDAIMCLSRVEE